jgi:DNA-binding MarR family transcriptional regulator
VANHERQNFIKLMDYFQANLDFERLVEDGLEEVYYSGMKFYDSVAGNASYNHLFEEDIAIMLSLRGDINYGSQELADMHGLSRPSVYPRMKKLIGRGFCYSYKEGKLTYYGLTPRGEKYLLETILES